MNCLAGLPQITASLPQANLKPAVQVNSNYLEELFSRFSTDYSLPATGKLLASCKGQVILPGITVWQVCHRLQPPCHRQTPAQLWMVQHQGSKHRLLLIILPTVHYYISLENPLVFMYRILFSFNKVVYSLVWLTRNSSILNYQIFTNNIHKFLPQIYVCIPDIF